MKVKYSADADILTFILQDHPPVNAISELGGVIVSYDEVIFQPSVEKGLQKLSSENIYT